MRSPFSFNSTGITNDRVISPTQPHSINIMLKTGKTQHKKHSNIIPKNPPIAMPYNIPRLITGFSFSEKKQH